MDSNPVCDSCGFVVEEDSTLYPMLCDVCYERQGDGERYPGGDA